MTNKQRNVGSFAPAKLQVIIAIAMITVIGFSFAACDKDGDGNGNGNGNGNGGGFSQLTITGLPSGTYSVYVFASGADISTYQKFNAAIKSGDFEAGGISLSNNNVFSLVKEGTKTDSEPYKGSGSKKVCLLKGVVEGKYTTVTLSNGNATVAYSSFTSSFTNN